MQQVASWGGGDDQALDKLEQLPGRYWRICDCYRGRPVYRKELLDGAGVVADQFMFVAEISGTAGWAISVVMGSCHDEHVRAWAPLGDVVHPKELHFPVLGEEAECFGPCIS